VKPVGRTIPTVMLHPAAISTTGKNSQFPAVPHRASRCRARWPGSCGIGAPRKMKGRTPRPMEPSAAPRTQSLNWEFYPVAGAPWSVTIVTSASARNLRRYVMANSMRSITRRREPAGAAVGQWRRFVAMGDSMTEGLGDHTPAGPIRGWADRLAQTLADTQDREIQYANLAVRGSIAAQVHDEQLPVALGLEPDLASVVAGVNDLLRPRFDLKETVWNLESAWANLRAAGATVLSFTFPDITSSMVLPPHYARRLASLNHAIRIAAARHSVLVVDLANEPAALHPGFWAPDRLHANEIGHDRISAAMADILGLPGADDSWSAPLPPLPARGLIGRARGHLAWAYGEVLPWMLRVAARGDFRECRSAKHTEFVRISPAASTALVA
jgi:lysophospholipase L1-like esterase